MKKMKRMKIKRIKDVLDVYPGFFQLIKDPLWGERYSSMDMDIELLVKYGDREISPLIEFFIEDGELDESSLEKVVNLVYRKHEENWKRKFEVLDSEYEALDTINVKELEDLSRDTRNTDTSEDTTIGTNEQEQESNSEQKYDKDTQSTTSKTGTDKVKMDSETTNKEETSGSIDGVEDDKSKSELSFDGRKDIETVNTENKTKTDEKVEDNTSSTLSFKDRKDTHERDLKTTVDNESIEDSETIESGSSNSNTEQGVYGFNSDSPVPSERTEVDSDDNRTTNVDRNQKDDGSTKESGNTSDSKSGSEKTTRGGSLETSSNDKSENTGTIEDEKRGKETTSNDGKKTTTQDSEQTVKNDGIEDTNQQTTYDTTESSTIEGVDKTTNIEDGTVKGKTNQETLGSVESEGTIDEIREYSRTGNEGGVSSTELLEKHIEFWKWNFLDEVYKDVADMISLRIYRGEM